MKIQAGFEITYYCEQPTAALLMLNIEVAREKDLLTPSTITTNPSIHCRTYLDSFGNRVIRTLLPKGAITFASSFVIADSGEPDVVAPAAQECPIEQLPDDVLVYLLASRYCDTEALAPIAWRLFGQTPTGWARVQAICDYVHDRISFGYIHADATRTASQGHEGRVGVCRDFAHLAVALCRCMNIPARYCTGYLGDIGIAPIPDPMDFSAWFEVFLDGRWYTFDARHNEPRIGRIVMARGRDAADVAISTTFGAARLDLFKVVTDELPEQDGSGRLAMESAHIR